MVKGILADVNCEGHLRYLLWLLRDESRRELWDYLALSTPTFADLGLQAADPDREVWLCSQREQLVLLTINRNEDDPDSLETTIRSFGTPQSLPVLTLSDPERLLHDRAYAERTADKLLQYLFDIEIHRGMGRGFIP
jgi:hypothetical protein